MIAIWLLATIAAVIISERTLLPVTLSAMIVACAWLTYSALRHRIQLLAVARLFRRDPVFAAKVLWRYLVLRVSHISGRPTSPRDLRNGCSEPQLSPRRTRTSYSRRGTNKRHPMTLRRRRRASGSFLTTSTANLPSEESDPVSSESIWRSGLPFEETSAENAAGGRPSAARRSASSDACLTQPSRYSSVTFDEDLSDIRF